MITDDSTVRCSRLPSTVARFPTWAGACGFCPKIAMDFPCVKKRWRYCAIQCIRSNLRRLYFWRPLVPNIFVRALCCKFFAIHFVPVCEYCFAQLD